MQYPIHSSRFLWSLNDKFRLQTIWLLQHSGIRPCLSKALYQLPSPPRHRRIPPVSNQLITLWQDSIVQYLCRTVTFKNVPSRWYIYVEDLTVPYCASSWEHQRSVATSPTIQDPVRSTHILPPILIRHSISHTRCVMSCVTALAAETNDPIWFSFSSHASN